MKFTVSSKTLLSALTLTGKAITKSVVPITENYLLSITKDKCRITGTNLEIFISKEIELQSDIELLLCLPAKKLLDLFKKMTGDHPVTFEIKEVPAKGKEPFTYNVKIIYSSGSCSFAGEQGKMFPSMPEPGESVIKLDSESLLNGISKTAFIVDPNINKPGLSKALIDITKTDVKLVSCDVRVLSAAQISEGEFDAKQLLISKTGLDTIGSINLKGEIELSYTERDIVITSPDSFSISCRIYDEKYPNYVPIIPKNCDKLMTVDISELSSAIQRVALFGNTSVPRINFEFVSGVFTISTFNIDLDEHAKEEVHCAYTGEDFKMGLVGSQIVNLLSKMNSADAYFGFSSLDKPAVIRETDDAESPNVMLAMPVMTE